MDTAPAPITATEIRQAGPDRLAIRWSDGAASEYPVRELRLACACAHCIDEWTGAAILEPGSVPEDVRPIQIAPVGRYGIRIDWSDGHTAGIYSFRRLRELASNT
jgi:ATP-binding protein involved in chromosome partitioning